MIKKKKKKIKKTIVLYLFDSVGMCLNCRKHARILISSFKSEKNYLNITINAVLFSFIVLQFFKVLN